MFPHALNPNLEHARHAAPQGLISGRTASRLQLGSGRLIEPMVDFAGVDEVFALASAHKDAVELVLLQCKTGDRQRLALGACFLYPVIAPGGKIAAVANF